MRLTKKMSRLTHKYKHKADNKRFVFDIKDYRKVCQKLGQHEDIEEELGIDLITLYKALKRGVWYRKGKEIKHFIPDDYFRIVLDCNGSTETINYWLLSIINVSTNEYIDDFFVDEYGKIWALTKEDLEKKI